MPAETFLLIAYLYLHIDFPLSEEGDKLDVYSRIHSESNFR